MNANRDVDIDDAFERGTPIDDAMEAAFREAVEQHRRARAPMVFWEDGKVVLIPAEQVQIRDEPPPRAILQSPRPANADMAPTGPS